MIAITTIRIPVPMSSDTMFQVPAPVEISYVDIDGEIGKSIL
jgi:hypothetical protein